MIDHRYQTNGFGFKAMELVLKHVRSLPNATHLHLSYVPADGDPSKFYAKFGFVDTDKWQGEQKIMTLEL